MASDRSKLKAIPKKTQKKIQKTSPKTSSDAELLREIHNEIWPAERAVLFKPERLRYVRKLLRPKGCVFCATVAAKLSPKSLLLYSDDLAMIILNKFPYNSGHLLVLPRRHCGDFLQLNDDENQAMSRCLRMAVAALTEIYQPSGFNIGLNLGAASGAGIPEHLHYHVIPRWNGDTNFFPLIADTKVVIETLEKTSLRLRELLNSSLRPNAKSQKTSQNRDKDGSRQKTAVRKKKG
jgi:ATP adenylyltransferase